MCGFDNKLVLVGPYVGSIETEITVFKPFFEGIKQKFDFPNIIVSTHYNRSFLYDNPVIPIFKQYSHDEKGQIGHRHDRMRAKEYQYLINEIKDQISEITRGNKKDIVTYNLGYSATANYNSLSKKVFDVIIDREDITDEVLFVPHQCRSKKEMRKIYNNIKGLKLVTTKEGYLKQYNTIEEPLEDYYESMIKRIVRSKGIITPSSFWTLFCNIHGIPVFSGGDNISMYRDVYRFDNRHFKGIPFKRGNNINIVIQAVRNFIEELNNEI